MSENENLAWRKSSRSVGQGACVELAPVATGWLVRDSKNPTGPRLTASRGAVARLVAGLRAGGAA